MARIFISYSSRDRAAADEIAEDLRGRRAAVFIDYQRLKPGGIFSEQLREEITACEYFLLLISVQSSSSKWVYAEVQLAHALNKSIIPVILEPVNIVSSPFWYLLPIEQIDFTQQADGALEKLAAAVGVTNAPHGPVPWSLEPETVPVPAGSFIMGSTPEQLVGLALPELYDPAWEQPQRTITLPDYWIGKYPVTVGEFRAFVEAGGYREKKWWTQSGWQEREKEKWTAPRFWDDSQWTANDGLPVVGVSWYEAYAYCSWLAEWTSKPYRLPGDAEWEKAARGTEGGIYPWGNEWRAGVCNTREAGIGHTTSVDRFSPAGDSPYGAADMIGNVWEWCLAKWCKEYADPEAIDPEGDSRRCLRGGAWGDNGDYARSAVRSWFVPGGRYYDRGFRVAVSAPV